MRAKRDLSRCASPTLHCFFGPVYSVLLAELAELLNSFLEMASARIGGFKDGPWDDTGAAGILLSLFSRVPEVYYLPQKPSIISQDFCPCTLTQFC